MRWWTLLIRESSVVVTCFEDLMITGTYATFRKVFEEPILRARQPDAKKHEQDLGTTRSNELSRITSAFILRRTSEVNAAYLCSKTEYIFFCKPGAEQLRVYKAFLRCAQAKRLTETSDSSLHLTWITYLRQICNAPSILFDKTIDDAVVSDTLRSFPPPVLSSKMLLLERLLASVHKTNREKIVVVSNFTKISLTSGCCRTP